MLRRSVLLAAVLVPMPQWVWAGDDLEQSHQARPARSAPLSRVERGERIAVEVTSGAARLVFEATAESGGRVGNFVLVRNPVNGRLFQAKVTGKGKVTVQK